MDIDWDALRVAAIEAATHAYALYSRFHVGAAGLVDDGRIVRGCNVENASYGLGLCAECGMVSALAASGGGRLVAVVTVAGDGQPVMPCGRCRQLLWEHGGPECLVDGSGTPMPMREVLPGAFDEPMHDLGNAAGMNAVDVIRIKRDGGRIPDDAIRWFLQAYTDGEIPDEQASASAHGHLLPGAWTTTSWSRWTAAMIDCGERLDLSAVGRPKVDKHSTGGVGDKVSICLAPLVAACGVPVPMVSGRGLGHTGGTLDKLEAIPGFRVSLVAAEMLAQLVREVGACMIGQTAEIAPADKRSTRCAT